MAARVVLAASPWAIGPPLPASAWASTNLRVGAPRRSQGRSLGVLGCLTSIFGSRRLVKGPRSSYSCVSRAVSFTSESNAESAQAALNEVLSAVQPKSGFAVMLIPRRFLSDASSLVQQAVQSLVGVQVVACVTGGPTLQLCALEGPAGQVQAFSAEPGTLAAQHFSAASNNSIVH